MIFSLLFVETLLGIVANPTRGQLNGQGGGGGDLSSFAPENLVSRDGFGRPVQRQPAYLHNIPADRVLTYGIPPEFRGGVHLFSFITVVRHRVSPECIESRNCVPMVFTAESPPTRGQ